MSKIKICGLRRPEDIKAVNKYLPEYVGFVFYKKSKRYVTEEEAEKLRKLLDKRIISAGVFVDAEKDEILRLMRKGIISVAQLHGNESEDYIRELKEELKKNVSFDVGSYHDGNKIHTGSSEEDMIHAGRIYKTEERIIKAYLLKAPDEKEISDPGTAGGKDVKSIISDMRHREKVEHQGINNSNRLKEILNEAKESSADYILFDSGFGSGKAFDWNILKNFEKPYFLAGGLNPENVSEAIEKLEPYAVDVSSGVETDGYKDADRIRAFVENVRHYG